MTPTEISEQYSSRIIKKAIDFCEVADDDNQAKIARA